MRYIEPHGHMVSRTMADYEAMALAGCRAICEPAFWAGFDRSSAQGFHDYFRQITTYEPNRAAKWCIEHYCWLCINPKEAEDMGLAREVIAMIPEFLEGPNVLGIGEIGLNKNSRNELKILEAHIQLAVDHDQLILVHTPHLEDKLKGTRLIIDALKNHSWIDLGRVILDHIEEHTIKELVEIIVELLNFRGKVIWLSDKPDGQLRKPSDNSKLKSYLPSFEFTSLYDGLKETISWFEDNYPNVRM